MGKTGLIIPDITFGSAILGNLFQIIPNTTKQEILQAIFEHIPKPVVIDTAGKYGAGLALEVLGKYLRELGVSDEDVVISNKLGWVRKPLTTPEPTFEPGVWFGLEHDAEQVISYDGILRCWEQGLELLGGNYSTQLVSVHDPDEYIAAADSAPNRRKRLDDILGAYKALDELKAKGYVRAIGIGAKNWKIIAEISDLVNLDWVMLANSYTLYSHPADLLKFMGDLYQKQIVIINAAVFNSGFLVGGDFFNYRRLDTTIAEDRAKIEWRNQFFEICKTHQVKPVEACVQFGKSHPAIAMLALSASEPQHIEENIAAIRCEIPATFWNALQIAGLIEHNHPYF